MQLLFLVGPTGSGKNTIARHIAASLHAEIISVDSMKIYQGMNIGTAKPSPSLQKKYHYHLIDIIKPSASYNVAHFVRDCERVINEITARQHQPLLAGGTPLYIKTLLQGIFHGPAAQPKLRQRLESLARQKDSRYLYDKLKQVDPVKADQIHPNDTKRIIRALEVYELTGQPLSQLQTQWSVERKAKSQESLCSKPYALCSIMVGLQRERGDLYQRINQRVDRMFARGLVEEARQLFKTGHLGLQASESLGYKEVIKYLKGELTLPETIEMVKLKTRHLARKQITWFRRFPQIKWFQIKPADTIDKIARYVLDKFSLYMPNLVGNGSRSE